jgi:DNA-binding response OmpR family regulator
MSVTPAGPGPAGSRGRILLVEDDPEAALFAVHVLAKRGQFEVTHTPDPAVALQMVTAGRWDLVVTDVDLPGMNGFDLLDALHRVAPGLPVAVVSAHAHLRATALLGHADHFLAKPLRIDQLLATATALIGRATGQ